MTLASFAAFFGAQVFLGPDGHGSSLSDPGVLRAVAGIGALPHAVGLLGGALGWIVRSTAGAITALVALLLIVPDLVTVPPGSWADTITKYLPTDAGEAFVSSERVPDTLAPWTGLVVLALWVGVAFVAAVVLVRRRDA